MILNKNKNMPFYKALEKLLKGHVERICRKGWNGQRMFVYLMKGYPDGVIADDYQLHIHSMERGSKLKFRPYIVIKDAQGMIVPWVPSQTDLQADDWTEAE